MSKTLTVRLTGRVFFANESSDFSSMIEMTCHAYHVFAL